ncbi:hypothetical protein [Hymenobacter volaticus]|uniref:Uncharacterized protein n=1 Tax=Hymenobacter volaticus TaxID=2932254 RepID=A0ABY4GDQ1_9BACT|nr:hypothetical protein [Hymenobacter volaticus]UOQ68984.1 hypothetical protein MUN86_26120 [Hymenobacter volaticus]
MKSFFTAILPVVVFVLLYQPYLYFYYRSHEHLPELYQNWGYVLAIVLLVTRLVNLACLKQREGYADLLTANRIGCNLFVLLVAWLVLGNVRALLELFRPYSESMILHILSLFLVSLVGVREVLCPTKPFRSPDAEHKG